MRLLQLGLLSLLAVLFALGFLTTAGDEPARAAFPGANGKIAFESDRDGDSEIYVINLDGSQHVNLTDDPADDGFPAWSPDGSKIAFQSDRDGNFDIYVMNADGGDVMRLSDDPGRDVAPAWSPDGLQIAFVSDRDGNDDLYVMSSDGSGQTNLTNNPASDGRPAWSPDGSKIAFHRRLSTYVMNTDGTSQSILVNGGVGPDWSPDGLQIAFADWQSSGISVIDTDGGDPTELTYNLRPIFGVDFAPAWSPDGSKIAFAHGAAYVEPSIYVMSTDGSARTRLTRHEARDTNPDWQPFPTPLPGDVNCGRSVDSVDAHLVLRFDSGLIGLLVCDQNADVNEDGGIDSVDAVLILQFTAGLLNSLPP